MPPVVNPEDVRKRHVWSHSGWGGASASLALPIICAHMWSVFFVGIQASYERAGHASRLITPPLNPSC
jgi:hypothetical protein